MKIQQENICENSRIREICEHFLSWTIPVIWYTLSNLSSTCMWLDLQELVLLPMTESSIFFAIPETYVSIHYQVSLPKWISLELFASAGCFSPANWLSMSGLGPWWSSGKKVEDCDVEWRPLLSLSHHFSWLWALCGPYQGLFHYFTFVRHYSWIPFPAIWPLPPSHCLSSPDTTIWEPTFVKNYLNWWETYFLSTWLEDGFRGKELLHNVWKFCTCSFS